MKGKPVESIQDIKAATTVQLKMLTQKGLPELLQKMSKTIGVFKARVNILKE